MKPKITILTACYNGAAHIEETIQSVIAQCYDNLEYVIVDGGSTDGTLDIIKKYEKYVWKLELTDGVNVFYGFEYHTFRDLDINQLKNITSDTNKYLKVLLGPNIDVHRGIFYLDSTNFKILG